MANIVQFKDKKTNAYVKIDKAKRLILGHKEIMPECPWLDLPIVKYSAKYNEYSTLEELVNFSRWLARKTKS